MHKDHCINNILDANGYTTGEHACICVELTLPMDSDMVKAFHSQYGDMYTHPCYTELIMLL